MNDAELRATFDAPTIRDYGGSGAGLHSDAEAARAQGFPEIVSWGTLTVMPFWELLGRIGHDVSRDVTLDVRLTKPVCAGDEVTYAIRAANVGDGGSKRIEMEATTARFGVVATAVATLSTENSKPGDK
jgi:acyl dehydratase